MITVVPIGEVEKSALETLRQPLTEVSGQRTWAGDGIELLSSHGVEVVVDVRLPKYMLFRGY